LVNKERQRRTLERELENGQAQLAKTQHKLHEVKTNKEYSAVLAEITAAKQQIMVLEDRILELMEALEQQRQTVQRQEQHVHETGQQLHGQREEVQQVYDTLQQQIGAEEGQRRQVITVLSAPLYLAYQRLAAQRNGQVVVEVQAETCGGCHLKVRPQLLSEIRQQDKLVPCPHCQRLLLWPLAQDGRS
jgi:predicted  nucleic acid-binding Zn-ribbon protein